MRHLEVEGDPGPRRPLYSCFSGFSGRRTIDSPFIHSIFSTFMILKACGEHLNEAAGMRPEVFGGNNQWHRRWRAHGLPQILQEPELLRY